MTSISIDRSQLLQKVIVSLTTLAALVLLSLMLAHWVRVWFIPDPDPSSNVTMEKGNNIAAADDLFGVAQHEPISSAPEPITIKLLGVVSASGDRPGYAIVQLDSKEIVAVVKGEDIEPGDRLIEVHPDHIVLERKGLHETLALTWPEKVSSTNSPVSSDGSNAEPITTQY